MVNKQGLERSTARIPYYRAPFYFAPEYLASPEAWQESFRRLADQILLDKGCGGKVIKVAPYWIMIGWGTLEFMIDARFGKFEVWENDGLDDDNWSSDYWSGVEAVPSLFIDTIRSEVIPERLAASVSRQIIPFADVIFQKMSNSFEKALHEKHAQIQVQPRSPLPTTPFIPLEPDQRRYFPLDFKERDFLNADELDEATGPNGERLFSYCVVALQRSAAVNITRAKKADGLRADGRFRFDRPKIERIIKEEYQLIRSNPSRTKAALVASVETRLKDKSPGRTTLHQWIKDLFPNF